MARRPEQLATAVPRAGNTHRGRTFSRLDVDMATTFAGTAARALEFTRPEFELRGLIAAPRRAIGDAP